MGEGGQSTEQEGYRQETKSVIDSKLETIFEKEGVGTFFTNAIDYALSEPQNFSRFYGKFFAEKFPGKTLAQAPDNRLNVLGVFTYRFSHIEELPDFDQQKQLLFQQAKEVKEFSGAMEQRKKDVQQKGKNIFSELNIKEHGQPLSEQEIEELTTHFRSNIEDLDIQRRLMSYYLYARGEFPMPNSAEHRKAAVEDKDYINKINKRRKEIRENPEEIDKMVNVITDKVNTTIEKSNNPQAINIINQENLNAPYECELEGGEFLHGGDINDLEQVRRTGILCHEIAKPELGKRSMSLNWGGSISFGRQKDEVIETRTVGIKYANPFLNLLYRNSFLERYRGNIASYYGAYDVGIRHFLETGKQIVPKSKEAELEAKRGTFFDIKAAGDDAITYVLKKQKDSYEMSAGTATAHSDEYGVGIGVPGTEIKSIIIDAGSETALRRVFSELFKYSFYIPVYDSETGILVNEDMKKLYNRQ